MHIRDFRNLQNFQSFSRTVITAFWMVRYEMMYGLDKLEMLQTLIASLLNRTEEALPCLISMMHAERERLKIFYLLQNQN